MAKLTLTDSQGTALGVVDQNLEDVFMEGAQSVSVDTLPITINPSVLQPMPKYDELQQEAKSSIKLVFKQVIAAFLAAFNLRNPLPPDRFSGSISTTPSGTAGTLTFQDGMITGFSEQTIVRFTGTIPLAAITQSGAQGSIQITDGIVTSVTPPT